nr:DNA-directed DNA polymerase [Tanacetum cinerariifolium]
MADQRTMAELLRAPTEGYAEAIVVSPILADQFELKHSLINMMTMDQFFRIRKDNPHDHIRAARRITNLCNEISNQQRFDESFHEAWDRHKDLLRTCPHHGFTELHQLDTFYNALNPADQDSLNAAAGGNLLKRRTQDMLTIIENKSKVRNSRNKSIFSQVKSCDANSNSSSEIAKLTHAVNQQTSAITTAMTAFLKQFQATLPPASVKAVEENYVTCGGAHPYYQCLTVGGNTFPELQDNIQGYVLAAAVNYNQGNFGYRPPGSGSLPSNTTANSKGKLKAITTRSGLVINGPTVSTPPPFINPEEDEHAEETLTDLGLFEYSIKVPPHPIQKYKPPSQREYVLHQEDPLHPNIPYPSRMLKQKQQEKDEKLPKKLGDPGKFLIPCGFSELKCKALANLGASINLMPLSVWKKLGLPELISTRMTLELANQSICTHARIARDVFVPIVKFTFPGNFVIVDYEGDPIVLLILGRHFLRTAHALINAHESINLINVFNNSSEDFLEDLFSNQPSGNPTFFSHPELTSPKVKDDIFDSEGGNEFADEVALITFPPKYNDDIQFDIEFDLKGIEFLLHRDIDSSLKDSIDQTNPADNFVDYMPEMFTDEHALDFSSPPIFDEYDDDFLEIESDAENVYDDPFDSKGEKIK